MLLLFHELFFIAQSIIKWLLPKPVQRDEIDSTSFAALDELEKQILPNKDLDSFQIGENQVFENAIVEEKIVPEEVAGISKVNEKFFHEKPSSLENSYIKDSIVDEYTDFVFLRDENTINYIQHGKCLFIMRGVSGSGKSTIVNAICKTYTDACVCSADHFFIRDGEYLFDHTLLSYAHEYCQEKAKEACSNAVSVIIIDNTNVRRWEMGNYFSLGLAYNYPVVVVQPKTPWSNDPEKLAQFNKHGVNSDIIRDKLKTFEEVIPLYFGWFANEQQSNALYQLGRKCLEECMKKFPDLKDLLLFQSLDFSQDVVKELNSRTIKMKEWYGYHFPELQNIVPNDLIYARVVKQLGHRENISTISFSNILPNKKIENLKMCAEFSMGAEMNEENIQRIQDLCEEIIELSEYRDQLEEFKRNPVIERLPKLTPKVVEAIGHVINSHTDMQEPTVLENFKLNSSRILHCTAKFMGTRRNPAPNTDLYLKKDIVQRSYGSVHDLTVTRLTVTPRTIAAQVKLSQQCLELYEKEQEIERKTKMGDNSVNLEFGMAAHVTIGTAPNIPPATSNDDLLDILEEEIVCKTKSTTMSFKSCAFGTVYHAGRDLFFVDLDNPVQLQGLFTGFYGGGNTGSPRK